MSGGRSRFPLMVFWFYDVVFVVAVAVAFLAPAYARPAAAVFGGAAALFGLCMALNLGGMANSSALAMQRRAATRRGNFTPFILTPKYARLAGLFFLAVGAGFAYQALYSPDF